VLARLGMNISARKGNHAHSSLNSLLAPSKPLSPRLQSIRKGAQALGIEPGDQSSTAALNMHPDLLRIEGLPALTHSILGVAQTTAGVASRPR